MEDIEEYFRNYLGETGVPLAYVIRKDARVPPEADDPSGNYTSPTDEMIARAPHEAGGVNLPTYLSDREKVWELLAGICRAHDCWTYFKPAQRARNGRLAFENLFNHYLGPNNVDNMATTAEKRLATSMYDGEKKRWNFERFVRNQVEQHTILNGLKDYGYSGIDDRSKVRHLVDGIRTRELDSVKTRIMSDATLRTNYDQCVTLYKDYILQMKTSRGTPDLQIAIVEKQKWQKRKAPGGGGNPNSGGEIKDRYYTAVEYGKLSNEDKKKLKDLRDARGHVGKKRKPDMSDVNRSISALAAVVAQAQGNHVDPDADTVATDNRNHPALTRQR
jgi:hypothetical protein